MILLIDNYDSFSYNLYQLIGTINPDLKVVRNDELDVAEIREMNPESMVISPGPGRPEDAGIIVELLSTWKEETPILGVCLGHQALCAALGAEITYAKELMHGKQSTVQFDTSTTLFRGCPEQAPVARYHSLAVAATTLPNELRVTAVAEDGEIMAVEHRWRPLYGVQFHPESILTPHGEQMLANFLNTASGDKNKSR